MLATLKTGDVFGARAGSGVPMLTLHGGLGLDHTCFRPWLDPLADTFDLTFFDQRGNGRSPAPNGLATMTHADWADEANELRETLGLGKIVLFGHSYGAFLALEYALRHPDTLRGLVLCEVAPIIDYPNVVVDNVKRLATSPEIASAVLSNFGRPAKDDAELAQIWEAMHPIYFHRYDAARSREMNDRIVFRAEAYNRSTGQLLPTFDVRARLGEIQVPTLILVGRHDWILPVEQGAERVHAGIASSRIETFEDSGHFPFIEEQPRFLEVMRAFAKRV